MRDTLQLNMSCLELLLNPTTKSFTALHDSNNTFFQAYLGLNSSAIQLSGEMSASMHQQCVQVYQNLNGQQTIP